MKKMLLSRKDLLQYLGISRNTLNDIIANDPTFPGPKTRTKFSKPQIDQWLETASLASPYDIPDNPPGQFSQSFLDYLENQN